MSLLRIPGPVVVAIVLAAFCATGCGPALYATHIHDAEREFKKAGEENAGWYAPYEFHFASAHLEKAREEAAEASYEDAVRFARTAEDFSLRALEITRRKRGAAR